ncbi:hypothetical protein [Desulfovibrio inopinatus]|uniref:hypothetical protein n=1 Tax=Desulfovibrio inopinatus TaxID=102109 RepID=UPI0004226A12|nr:hypothetical protein [Desulfovibrio inopinatus]
MFPLSPPPDKTIADAISSRRSLITSERHYIETMLENMSSETFFDHAQRGDLSEVDIFIDILTFPSHDLRQTLEDTLTDWSSSHTEPGALAMLSHDVHARHPVLNIIWPTGGDVTFPLDFDHISSFIRRLHPLRTMPASLSHLLSRHLSDDTVRKLRVRYRQTRFHPNHATLGALTQLAEAAPHFDNQFSDAFDFLTSFLEHYDVARPLADALCERRTDNLHHITGHARFLDQLGKSNFETLLMQGVRASHVDTPRLAHENRIIEAIGRFVFQRYYPLECALPQETDLGTFNGQEGVQSLLEMWHNTD